MQISAGFYNFEWQFVHWDEQFSTSEAKTPQPTSRDPGNQVEQTIWVGMGGGGGGERLSFCRFLAEELYRQISKPTQGRRKVSFN